MLLPVFLFSPKCIFLTGPISDIASYKSLSLMLKARFPSHNVVEVSTPDLLGGVLEPDRDRFGDLRRGELFGDLDFRLGDRDR